MRESAMHKQLMRTAWLICVLVGADLVMGQAQPGQPAQPAQPAARPARPAPPARDPNSPGFVKKKELADGAIPPVDEDGDFVIGPTHKKAPEMVVKEGVPKGTVFNLTMKSEDSKIYPGIARDRGTFGTPDPANPAKLIVTTSHPAPYTRKVAVYVPRQYEPRTEA